MTETLFRKPGVMVDCVLCGKRLPPNGGSITAHANKHVRAGEAREIGTALSVYAENRYELTEKGSTLLGELNASSEEKP